MHEKMQDQKCGEGKNPNFPVKKHQDQAYGHQCIKGENNEEIPSRDVQVFMLQVFVQINPEPHDCK